MCIDRRGYGRNSFSTYASQCRGRGVRYRFEGRPGGTPTPEPRRSSGGTNEHEGMDRHRRGLAAPGLQQPPERGVQSAGGDDGFRQAVRAAAGRAAATAAAAGPAAARAAGSSSGGTSGGGRAAAGAVPRAAGGRQQRRDGGAGMARLGDRSRRATRAGGDADGDAVPGGRRAPRSTSARSSRTRSRGRDRHRRRCTGR